MSLLEIINSINAIADRQPNINQVIKGGDIYDLNAMQDIRYSVFCLTQGEHIEENGQMHYNFVLYYTDRLFNDKTNRVEIQSTGIKVLSNILETLENTYDEEMEIGTKRYQVFQQQFNDDCAGVYCTVTITTDVQDNCPDIY